MSVLRGLAVLASLGLTILVAWFCFGIQAHGGHVRDEATRQTMAANVKEVTGRVTADVKAIKDPSGSVTQHLVTVIYPDYTGTEKTADIVVSTKYGMPSTVQLSAYKDGRMSPQPPQWPNSGYGWTLGGIILSLIGLAITGAIIITRVDVKPRASQNQPPASLQQAGVLDIIKQIKALPDGTPGKVELMAHAQQVLKEQPRPETDDRVAFLNAKLDAYSELSKSQPTEG